MEFRIEPLDLASRVRDVAGEFFAAPQARGHRIELDVDGDVSTVCGDREVLRTLVWNLLENSAKYSPDCDTIWVTLRQRDAAVELSVRDRGVGIPKSEQRRVFERFVRGAGARTSGVGGTGIGLAMVKRIVEAHGGRITLESEPGAGSTFTVVLPMDSPHTTPNSETVAAAG
jgi:signal transduction histidine kinase